MDRVSRQHESDSNRTATVREDQEPGRVSATAVIQRASASAPASVGPAQEWSSSVAPVGDAAARAHGLVPFDPGAQPVVQMRRNELADDLDQLDAQSDGDIADDLVHDADRVEEARDLYQQGQEAYQAGDFVRAGQLFERAAVANRSERRSALYNAALAYGRALTARGDGGRARSRGGRDPQRPSGQLSDPDLAALGESPGESAGVIADQETARDDFQQGMRDYRAGEDEAAARSFENSAARAPQAAGDLNYNAGMAHFRGGDYEAAVRTFRSALGLAAPAAGERRGPAAPGAGPVQRDAVADAPDEAAHVHALAAQGIGGGGGALPHLDTIQRAFGHHDVTGIVSHVGGASAEAAEGMGARAYAAGDHVAFAESPDLHLAAHEAAHVVQQRGGVSLKSGVGEAGDAYEQHADAVADRVVRGESAADLLDEMSGGGAAVQRAVQRDGGSVRDWNGTHTFTETGSYESFREEVRRWLARRVQSRTGGAHRERTLIGDEALRPFWSERVRGQPITVTIHLYSNGYSYRRAVLAGEDAHLDLDLGGETPTPTPTGPSEQSPTGRPPQQVPESATPAQVATEAAQDQVRDTVLDTIRDEIIEQVAQRIGQELLSEMLAVIGAINTCVQIFREIWQLADPTLYSKARGFGAAVQGNRIAEYVFTRGTGDVMGAANQYVSSCSGSSDERVQHFAEVMRDVLEEMGQQWNTIRQRIDAQRSQPASTGGGGRSFQTQAELATYLVHTSPNAVDIRFWRDQFHTAYQSSGSFSLRAAQPESPQRGGR